MIKKIKGFILIALIIGLGYYVVFKTDLLNVNVILYNENAELDIYELQRYSNIHYGDSIFTIDMNAAKIGLLQHPFVKDVFVNKNFPGQVIFNFTYRTHYFSIRYSDLILSLDSDLNVLKVLETESVGYTVEGFRFNGFSTGKRIDVDQIYVLENIVKVIDLMNQSGLIYQPVIEYKENNIKVKIDSMNVKFGNGDNIEERFNKFYNIYISLKDQSITAGTIDVSSDGLPVYKPFGE